MTPGHYKEIKGHLLYLVLLKISLTWCLQAGLNRQSFAYFQSEDLCSLMLTDMVSWMTF